MDELTKKVQGLVGEEYARACLTYGMFNNPHEGSAVLREEIEEALEDITHITAHFDRFWTMVRGNVGGDDALDCLSKIEAVAVSSAAELIQVAAMCQKSRLLYATDQVYKED